MLDSLNLQSWGLDFYLYRAVRKRSAAHKIIYRAKMYNRYKFPTSCSFSLFFRSVFNLFSYFSFSLFFLLFFSLFFFSSSVAFDLSLIVFLVIPVGAMLLHH